MGRPEGDGPVRQHKEHNEEWKGGRYVMATEMYTLTSGEQIPMDSMLKLAMGLANLASITEDLETITEELGVGGMAPSLTLALRTVLNSDTGLKLHAGYARRIATSILSKVQENEEKEKGTEPVGN